MARIKDYDEDLSAPKCQKNSDLYFIYRSVLLFYNTKIEFEWKFQKLVTFTIEFLILFIC